MQFYEVGKPFSPEKTAWPQAHEYNFRAGHHILTMFYRSPDPREIYLIREGEMRLALAVIGPNIWFMWNFGWGWQDSSFSIHLVNAEDRELPDWPVEPEVRALLTIFLVDAENGLLKAMRVGSFSHEFTRIFHKAIINQYKAGLPPDYGEIVKQQASMWDTNALVKHKAIVKCKLGD